MNFFKTFLASLLAVIIAFGLMVMIWSMVIAGMIASFGSAAPVVGNNSVLKLNLGNITDSPASSFMDDFDFLSMTPSSRTTLYSAVSAIQAAATDDRIKGIYINFDGSTSVSLANVEEIRAELVKFKESGKFIVAYNETYSHISYYLSSVADKVYMNPEGGMEWQGLSLQTMFYKGLLDKLDIEPQIFRHGTFKSAVEPYMYGKMSQENKLQYQTLVDSIWDMITGAVSESRGIPKAELNKWADALAIDSPSSALEKGLVDGLRYDDQVKGELASMIKGWSRGAEETASEGDESKPAPIAENDPRIVSFGDYAAQVIPASRNISKNKIAIVYAEGEIVSGDSGRGVIASESMLKRLAQVRKDPNVKAVVFRINSPGGSALASEVVWRELKLVKEKVPVVVSMGGYAASGGYYIACPADVIYADRSTLTGSIGVFGMHANIGKSLKKNLGITVDGVGSNAYADLGSLYREMSPAEKAYVQQSVESVYTTFVGHVSEGRNMTFEAVDKIGEGRVWTGADAVNIGLADGIGGMFDAIAIAADRAGVAEDFRVWEVTDEISSLSALLNEFSASVRESVLRDEMGEAFIHYNSLRKMLDEQGVQARMPYLLEVR